jgi:hypothetical protein
LLGSVAELPRPVQQRRDAGHAEGADERELQLVSCRTGIRSTAPKDDSLVIPLRVESADLL